MEIALKWLLYGSLHFGSDCNTGSCMIFPHFGNSNLGQLPYAEYHWSHSSEYVDQAWSTEP